VTDDWDPVTNNLMYAGRVMFWLKLPCHWHRDVTFLWFAYDRPVVVVAAVYVTTLDAAEGAFYLQNLIKRDTSRGNKDVASLVF